ncbi:hypothetical protein XPA_004140 [Xanthoria parietina]
MNAIRLLILCFMFVCCLSTPVRIKDATTTVKTTGRNPQDKNILNHGEATSLLPRTSISLNRYELIAFRLAAFINTPPLSAVPALAAAHLQQYRGPQLYATLRNHAREMWPTMINQQQLELAIGPFIFHMQTEKGQVIPLDFVERFCETMEMWATHGFMSLYLALVQDVVTSQRIAVGLSLLGRQF